MEKRILSRNQGRSDDNIMTLRKRFKVFQEQTMPVVDFYSRLGKVKVVEADKPADEVYASVVKLFT